MGGVIVTQCDFNVEWEGTFMPKKLTGKLTATGSNGVKHNVIIYVEPHDRIHIRY